MKKILSVTFLFLLFSITGYSQSKKTWEKTQSLNSIEDYYSFINKYPKGKYTALAKKQLSKLREEGFLNAKAANEKILPGVTVEEVISILSMEKLFKDLTWTRDIYISKGFLTKNPNEKSSYTGAISLDGYDIEFDKGKVVSKKMVSERLGTQSVGFTQTNYK